MTISATGARFDAHTMWVELSDGRTIGVPYAWFPRLLNANKAQRENVKIGRYGLHWPDIDEDISIAGLLAGRGDQTLIARASSNIEGNIRIENSSAKGRATTLVFEEARQLSSSKLGGGRGQMKQPGLDSRHRDQAGEIRRKNSNTLVGTLREEYGPTFAKGYRSDAQLGTVLKKEGFKSLNQLLRRKK